MKNGFITTIVCLSLFAAGVSPAQADSIGFMGSHKFVSDLQPTATITLPAFDTLGNTLTLTNVVIDVFHFASVELKADNDDPFQSATVAGRMFRQWSLTGPGVVDGAFNMTQTPQVVLSPDDGDLAVFDPTPLDGINFGLLSYGPLLSGTHNPAFGPYTDTGTVDFFVTPLLMSQDLQFVTPPDSWQLDVQNPSMTIQVNVTYFYTPEPAVGGFLMIAGLLTLKIRGNKRRS